MNSEAIRRLKRGDAGGLRPLVERFYDRVKTLRAPWTFELKAPER